MTVDSCELLVDKLKKNHGFCFIISCFRLLNVAAYLDNSIIFDTNLVVG